jgi:VCBS repeat protein
MRILGGSRMSPSRPRGPLAATALAGLCALCAAGPAQGSFTQEGSPIQVGTDPYGVVTGDFNGDARPDVATVNGTSSNLSVLLRQATGGFAQEAGSPFAVGSGPGYGVVGDFNGDGRPDVATGNFVAGSVSVLLRGAGGGFTAEAPAPFVASASSVAAADFNGDGLLDIAAPGLNTATVTTLLRVTGGFASEGTTATGTNPRDVAAADFNGDGRPDLAITNLGSASVTILLRNPANNGFTQEAGSPIPVGASPEGIEAADFNGDRLPDLAIATLGTNTVTVLLRQAGGGFAQEAGSPIAVGTGALGVASGDFDGDGRPDLAVTNNTAGTVSVLLRQAAGGFAPDASSPLAAPSANGVAAADFNGDGHADLAVSGDGPDSLTVFLNTTPPPAAAPQAPAPPPPPVPGKSVVVRVVSGQVFVKYPPGYTPRAAGPAKGFVPLTGAANIPVGSQVDTKKGRVALTSASDTGGVKTQSSDFYQGIFQVKQTVPKKKPKKPAALTTDLVMKGQIARSQCAPLKGARAAAVSKKKGPKSVLGKLWGNGKGKFRTSGKYSSATVRGTIWLVQDRCDGTLTKVTRGTVRVQDFKRKKTVTVKAGHSYLARAQRAASKSRR